jgi:hypothetical protein
MAFIAALLGNPMPFHHQPAAAKPNRKRRMFKINRRAALKRRARR